MTANDYKPLIDAIKARVSTWTARYLSYAGRLQLIQSVLNSLTNFWMSAFRLPSKCIKEIDQICSAFLWSGPSLNTKKAKVAWEEVCKPKMEGGLGLRNLKEVNQVSILKLVWKIGSSQKSLWVDWLRKYLMRKGNFWSINETQLGSWMWRKILKMRAVAKEFYKVKIHNGKDTSFWYEQWSDMGILHSVFGNRGFIDMGISELATVEEGITGHRRRRHRSSQLNKLEDIIDKFRPQIVTEGRDVALWRSGQDNFKPNFNTNLTWNQIRRMSPTQTWAKGIWFAGSTPKYSFMSWICMKNRLSTGEKLQKWNPGTDPKCVLCQHPIETQEHLFFQCDFSRQIWENLSKGLMQTKFTTTWTSIRDYISIHPNNYMHGFVLRYVFQATVYGIWRERNYRKHGEKPSHPLRMIKIIDKTVKNRLSSIRAGGDKRFEESVRYWISSRPIN